MDEISVTLSGLEWDAIIHQFPVRIAQIRVASRDTKMRVSERAMTAAMAEELEAIYLKIVAQRQEPIASRKA